MYTKTRAMQTGREHYLELTPINGEPTQHAEL